MGIYSRRKRLLFRCTLAAALLLPLCWIYVCSRYLYLQGSQTKSVPSSLSSPASNTTGVITLQSEGNRVKKTKPVKVDQNTSDTRRFLAITHSEDFYRIRNPDICKGNKKPRLVFMVHSATSHANRRQILRQTWANISVFQNSSYPFKVVYVLGEPETAKSQLVIEEENIKYGDIVQGKFRDTYNNLTYKAVLWLRWVSDHCSEVPYVVKVDDDVAVNIFRLFQIVQTMHRFDRKIICHACPKDFILREGVWKTNAFPGQKYYPFQFCKGYFVVMTSNIVPELYQASRHAGFFRMDDVYFTGILTHNVGNVTIQNTGNRSLTWSDSIKCFTNGNCHNIASVVATDWHIQIAWSIIVHEEKEFASQYVNVRMLSRWLSKPKLRFPGTAGKIKT